MKFGQIIGSEKFRLLKTALSEISHITIETNQTCNLKCKTCYNLYQDSIKTIEQIKEDIDLALTRTDLILIRRKMLCDSATIAPMPQSEMGR